MRASTICASTITAIYSLLSLGFWFHTDTPPVAFFGKYSTPYFVAVVALIALIPVVFVFFKELFTPQTFTMPSRKRVALPISVNLLVFVIAMIVGVSLANLYLARRPNSILQTRREELTKFHPFLQISNKPHDEWLKTNRWGLRGEEIDKSKGKSTYRILVLGGSTVLCDTVDFEHTHCRIAELLLRERYRGVKVEIQNAGTNWHTSEHSLIKLLFDLQDFDPDLVVVLHAINDLYRGFSPEMFARGPYRDDYGHFVGPLAGVLESYESAQQSAFPPMQIARQVFQKYWCSDFLHEPQRPLEIVEITKWKSLPAFERNMTDLARIAKSKGIMVLFATQPSLYKEDLSTQEQTNIWFPRTFCAEDHRTPSIVSMIHGMSAFNDATKQIAAREGALLVDLDSAVPKTLDYFVDDVHYTEKGNQRVGEVVAAFIIDARLIDTEMERRKQAPLSIR